MESSGYIVHTRPTPLEQSERGDKKERSLHVMDSVVCSNEF